LRLDGSRAEVGNGLVGLVTCGYTGEGVHGCRLEQCVVCKWMNYKVGISILIKSKIVECVI